jgi:hypothetical protein
MLVGSWLVLGPRGFLGMPRMIGMVVVLVRRCGAFLRHAVMGNLVPLATERKERKANDRPKDSL